MADAPAQCMDPDLISVMGWELLLKITQHLDTAGRSSWRLVSKAACQAVYDSTTALAPCSDSPASTASLLPQLVAKCSGLKQLSCVDLPHLNSIAGLLQLPPGLEALDISLTDVVDLAFITRCTALRRLKAEIVPACAGPELAAALRQLPGLTALSLRSGGLSVDSAVDVAAVLRSLTGMQELDIGMNSCAATTLLSAVPHLTGLRLLDASFGRMGGQALLPTILQLTGLRQLDLTCNELHAAGALTLAPALGKLQQLEALSLCSNGLGDEGAAALAPAIQQLTGLTVLRLGSNRFGPAAAPALVPALQDLTRLQNLQLNRNIFGADGAALLAPALQALTGLLRYQRVRWGHGGPGSRSPAPYASAAPRPEPQRPGPCRPAGPAVRYPAPGRPAQPPPVVQRPGQAGHAPVRRWHPPAFGAAAAGPRGKRAGHRESTCAGRHHPHVQRGLQGVLPLLVIRGQWSSKAAPPAGPRDRRQCHSWTPRPCHSIVLIDPRACHACGALMDPRAVPGLGLVLLVLPPAADRALNSGPEFAPGAVFVKH